MRVYVMTDGLQKRFISLRKMPVCKRCGKGFNVGERVLAKSSNRRIRHWHKSCLESVRI